MKTILPTVLLRMLCAIAVILLSFAHQPVFANSSTSGTSEFSYYKLPDGTIPVICATQPFKLVDKDDNEKHYFYYNNGCEACRLSASILCPEPPFSHGPRLNPLFANGLIFDTPEFVRQLFPPSAPPHAPPVFL